MKKVCFLLLLIIIPLTGCNSTKNEVLKNIPDEQKIELALKNIETFARKNLSQTSNVSSYVIGLEYSMDYRYIVTQGEKSLNSMLEKFAHGSKDRINEYIMAAACCKILKQNPHTKRWDTGREWYNNYMEFLYNNPNVAGKHEPINNPKFMANKHKPLSALISKKEMLERLSIYGRKDSVGKIVYIDLKTYKEYVFEDNPLDFNYQIDPDHMVWVVVKKYPEGISTKAGFFENATVISLFDSETGEILMSSVHGERISKYKQH